MSTQRLLTRARLASRICPFSDLSRAKESWALWWTTTVRFVLPLQRNDWQVGVGSCTPERRAVAIGKRQYSGVRGSSYGRREPTA